MSEKKLLFEIDGFKVYADTVYTVKDKIDYDAPSGFVDRGVSRLPSDGVGDTFTCGFSSVEAGSSEGTWDTGFFPESRCYRNLEPEVREYRAKLAKENVLDRYKAFVGGADNFSHSSSNKWWEKMFFRVYSGQVFDTSKTDHIFNLYFAVLTGHLAPETMENETRFKLASYIVTDINKGMKRKEEKALLEFKAIQKLMAMVDTDKKRAKAVLDYLGVTVSDTVNEGTLVAMFNELIKKDESKLKLFNKTVDDTESQEGREKIELFAILKKRFPNGGVSKSANGVYFFEGEEIGGDLRTAAANIATQKHFAEIKKELILGDDYVPQKSGE